MRSGVPNADAGADAYSVLGVKPNASMQEVRVAWLQLVKELHPDAGFDDPAASEHLKAINLAYQTLKDLEQGHTVGNAEPRTFRSARATFVIFLFLPIVAAVLMMGARTDWSLSSLATDTLATNQEQGIGEARDTEEKQLIASKVHEPNKLVARSTGSRDPSGQARDPTEGLGNEPGDDLTIVETAAASDRAERKSSKSVALQYLDAHSSQSQPNAPLATLQGAEPEQGDNDASLSGTQRGKTKAAFAATKSDKQSARSARPSTSVTQSELRWPSSGESFVGADGRIR